MYMAAVSRRSACTSSTPGSSSWLWYNCAAASGSYLYRDAKQYAKADVIDANGRTVMPGLIDAHVHLCMDGLPDNFRQMIMTTANYAVIEGVLRAQRDLEAGFTTIRCCGMRRSGCI